MMRRSAILTAARFRLSTGRQFAEREGLLF